MLYTSIDYWNNKFPKSKISLNRKITSEKYEILLKIAEIIIWNIFQMDGIKYVAPMSCSNAAVEEKSEVPPIIYTLFPNEKNKKLVV